MISDLRTGITASYIALVKLQQNMARFATPPFRYGLAVWLECATPTAFASGCNSQSSPGAFGFTPWFDRDAGYYAMIGMYQLGRATDTRV